MNHSRSGAPGHPDDLRYSGQAIALHWIVALLVFALVGLGWYMVDIPRGTPERASFYNLHKSIGLTAALFIALRLWWRSRRSPPPLPDSLAPWEARLATWGHRMLYACMVVMPLSGYIGSNFTKYGVKFYGLLELKPWGWEDKAIYAVFNNIHVFTSYLFVALIGLHVAAALKHLVVDQDGIFRRMLPRPRG